MSKQREALELALDAFENVFGKGKRCYAAMQAIREALAESEPLTDEELWVMWVESPSDVLRFARAIERAHGIGEA